MPLYEYECDACGRRFEVIVKSSETTVEACTICGKGPVHRQLSSPAIQFKGTGWYVTDYAQKGKSDAGSADSPAKTTNAAASDSSAPATDSSSGSSTPKSDTSAPKTDPVTSTAKPATGGTAKESK